MTQKSLTKRIGRYEYSLRPFPFDEHLELSAVLAQTAGPVAEVFGALVKDEWTGLGTQVQALGEAVFRHSKAGLLARLCKYLRVHHQPDKGNRGWGELSKQHVRTQVWSGFDGEVLEGYEAIYWVLGASFADFREAVTNGVALLSEQRSDAEGTAESTERS
jgi:hypothetical protein